MGLFAPRKTTRRILGRVLVSAAVGLGALGLGGCNTAEDARQEQVRAQLQGRWLREDQSPSVRLVRHIELRADGQFSERVERNADGQTPERHEYTGEWSYDGIHLKRRFLTENGRSFSGGQMRFATFPLVKVDAQELVMDDTISRQRVHYRRGGESAR